MSCKQCFKGVVLATECCTLKIEGEGGYKVTSWTENDYGVTLHTNNGNYEIGNLTTVDGSNLSPSEIKKWACDNFTNCCGADLDPDYEKVSVDTFYACLDGEKVLFKLCKNEIGDEEYIGSNGAVFTDYATIWSVGYTVECVEKEYLCTEVVLNLEEGETVDYAGLLANFELVGSFDDGTKNAEGIKFVNFVNMESQGFNYTYNGTSSGNPTAGQFQFGGQENNPISQDILIESNCGNTLITYIVYKCK